MDDETRNQFIAHVHEKIEQYGVTIIAVGADEEEKLPQFAYSIGLSPKYGYELVINGLDFEDMHYVLNNLSQRIFDKKLTPVDGLMVEGVLEGGYVVRLKQADPSWQMYGMMLAALALKEAPPVWQVQFPDREGRFPEQQGYDPEPYVQLDFSEPRP